MSKKGYLEGSEMATTFNMLRANDLIWSFVVNNYLMGKDPFPFDLLFWNADATRMPAAMHSYYLRNMYQKNLLARPGRHHAGGRGARPALTSTCCRSLSALDRERPASRPGNRPTPSGQLVRGPTASCCPAHGHIAGVINPPAAEQSYYYLDERRRDPPTAER